MTAVGQTATFFASKITSALPPTPDILGKNYDFRIVP